MYAKYIRGLIRKRYGRFMKNILARSIQFENLSYWHVAEKNMGNFPFRKMTTAKTYFHRYLRNLKNWKGANNFRSLSESCRIVWAFPHPVLAVPFYNTFRLKANSTWKSHVEARKGWKVRSAATRKKAPFAFMIDCRD